MRYTRVENVEPGNVLAKTIFTSDGRPLLNKGIQMTVGMIATLRRVGVTAVYVDDPQLHDIVVEELVSEETRRDALNALAEAGQCMQSGKDYSSKAISMTTNTIIEQILKNKNVMVSLTDIRTADNAQFIHALNVCILSTVIGINLNMPNAQLSDLAMGALLHDIGKLQVPKQELSNENSAIPRTLENKEALFHFLPEVGQSSQVDPEVWKHTWRGFKRLRKKNEFSIPMAHIALQHHEHVDGSGYPRGLPGAEIHRYAKIVAIANFYDNLVGGNYDKLYPPYEACELLMGFAGKWFEHEYVIQFLRSIAVYPVGSSLRLTNGKVAVVTDLHKGLPARPVVRVIHNPKLNSDEPPSSMEIDLAVHTTVFIEEVLD